MIFERAARREFAQAAVGISIALLAILTSTHLIRLLKDAAGGRIAPEAVASLLGFSLVNYLPPLLVLTLFVSIILSLSRVYRDSEMVVWLSCGQPLTAWIRPVLKFALPIVAGIVLLSGFLSPWANYSIASYREKLAARSDIAQVSPGMFREVRQGQRVFFVEALADDASRVGNIFVATVQDGRMGVVVSREGYQEQDENGDRFIVLEQGKRYEVEPGAASYRVMSFEKYRFQTEESTAKPLPLNYVQMPLSELLFEESNRARAELLWRIGTPLSAIILVLMAIPLSFVNPRAGRSAGMLLAILVYAIYNNLMSLSQSWVAQGKLAFLPGMLSIHVLMAGVMIAMFYWRMTVRRGFFKLGGR
ncbi:MAG: LPS export ABC transporter permease LptF [Rhodocyclales bacterium]|nr:LPS export ABC transporter permease LptF [Rhodocyclales bacterium]